MIVLTYGGGSAVMNVMRATAAVCALLFLVACQTAGSGQPTYSFLYTPADHVRDMIEINDLDEADSIYQSQKSFFIDEDDDEDTTTVSNDDDSEPTDADEAITLLLQAIEAEHGSALRASLNDLKKWTNWPVAVRNWPQVRLAIKASEKALQDYSSYAVFEEQSRLPPDYFELERQTSKLRNDIVASSRSLFRDYDVTVENNFLDLFPVKKGLLTFLADNRDLLFQKVDILSPEELSAFAKNYDDWIDESLKAGLAHTYFKKIIGDVENPDFPTVMRAVAATKENGFAVSEIEGVKVAAIEVTSRTLLEHGQIEFPIAIEKDLPFILERAELDEALSSPVAKSADAIILIDVAAARNNRKIVKTESIESEFQSGTKTVPNPAHNMAQNEVNNAQLAMQRAAINSASINAQYCYGMGCLGKAISQLAAAAAEAGAQDDLNSAMNKLQSTPMQLTTPVYSQYSFNKLNLDAVKEATVNFYVIDRNQNRYMKSNFDAIESKSFTVTYNISSNDRYKSRHLSNVDKEDDVVAFENAAITVKLSDLLTEYVRLEEKSQPLPELAVIRAEVLADKNKVLATYAKNQYDVVPDRNDARFDSVVAVYNPGGGMGTGFFVRDDLVLTNYHVIEGSQFIEMKLFSGQETFGKVIGSDPRLDLALIKSQARGKPVTFYGSNSLPQGSTVDIIGHPDGLEFSISRGVVSSLRELPSSRVPGGKNVRFIQTDAAINPGNSGGPMFLGNQVVGVNTFKLAATELEGLSFAVHYSEVLTFLKENNFAAGG